MKLTWIYLSDSVWWNKGEHVWRILGIFLNLLKMHSIFLVIYEMGFILCCPVDNGKVEFKRNWPLDNITERSTIWLTAQCQIILIIKMKWAALLAEFRFRCSICHSALVHYKKYLALILVHNFFLAVVNPAVTSASLTQTGGGLPHIFSNGVST